MRHAVRSAVQLMLLIALALLVLVPLLWLVSTSLKGPTEDIFSSPPALLPAQPSLEAYLRLFQDNPLSTYLINSTVVSVLAVGANLLFCSLAVYPWPGCVSQAVAWCWVWWWPPSHPSSGDDLYLLMVQLGCATRCWRDHPSGRHGLGFTFVRAFWGSRELEEAARIDGCSRRGNVERDDPSGPC